jgi:hypothetical protein
LELKSNQLKKTHESKKNWIIFDKNNYFYK